MAIMFLIGYLLMIAMIALIAISFFPLALYQVYYSVEI
jgi:hypothetical protein